MDTATEWVESWVMGRSKMRRRKRRTKFNKIWSVVTKIGWEIKQNWWRCHNLLTQMKVRSSLRFTGILLWEFLLCVHIVDSTSHTWLGAYSYDSRTQDRFERTCSNASNGRRTVASPTHLWRKAKYEEVPMVQLHKGLSLHNPLKKSDCYQK